MSLSDEKAKLDHEHKLIKKRIWLEKGLLAGIVLVFSICANAIVENYRDGLAETRHRLQTQDAILDELRANYDGLAAIVVGLLHGGNDNTDHIKALEKFVAFFNKSGRHFSTQFEARINRHVWIHEAIAREEVRLEAQHWRFVNAVFADFGRLTRYAEQNDKIDVSEDEIGAGFGLIHWTVEEIHANGIGRYFELNFEKWKRDNP